MTRRAFRMCAGVALALVVPGGALVLAGLALSRYFGRQARRDRASDASAVSMVHAGKRTS